MQEYIFWDDIMIQFGVLIGHRGKLTIRTPNSLDLNCRISWMDHIIVYALVG